MSNPLVRSVKSIVLTSDKPEALAAFYRDTLQIPLAAERHRGTLTHWAGQFGDLHIAIHERATFWLPSEPVAAAAASGTIVSFTIESLEPFLAHLESLHIEATQRNIGPMKF